MVDYPRFTTEQAAKAAGVPSATVSTWLKRGFISLVDANGDVPPDVLSPGTGRGRLFRLRSVIRIAIVSQLTRIGIAVPTANHAAMCFLDLGEGGAAFGDQLPRIGRMPGDLYPTGRTVLQLEFKNEALHPKVFNASDFGFGDANGPFHLTNPCVLVDLSDLVRRVQNSLQSTTP